MPFERTFDHNDWANGVDTVDAIEFNDRFNAIENDLDALGEYVNERLPTDEGEIAFLPNFAARDPYYAIWGSGTTTIGDWRIGTGGSDNPVFAHKTTDVADGTLALKLPNGSYITDLVIYGETETSISFTLLRASRDGSGSVTLLYENMNNDDFGELFSILSGDDQNLVDNSRYYYVLRASSNLLGTASNRAKIASVVIKYEFR